MKREELLTLLGEIDDRHIEGAQMPMHRRRNLLAPLALAACLCLLLSMALWRTGNLNPTVPG